MLYACMYDIYTVFDDKKLGAQTPHTLAVCFVCCCSRSTQRKYIGYWSLSLYYNTIHMLHRDRQRERHTQWIEGDMGELWVVTIKLCSTFDFI